MTAFVPDLSDETLCALVEALTESGQAVSLYDAQFLGAKLHKG